MCGTVFGDELTVTHAKGAIDIRFTDDSERQVTWLNTSSRGLAYQDDISKS